MRTYLLLIIFIAALNTGYSQGFFTSAANGDWNNAASWTLAGGTSTLNYPVAGDSVIIQNAHSIQVVNNTQCQSLTVKEASYLSITSNTSFLTVTNDLLITETSFADITAGLLTVTGNLTINQKSTVTQTGGAFSVIGLVFINSPSTSTGNTTLNVDAGAFNCVGGMTVTATTVPAGRIAEVKIGNSAVTVVGALTTISANAKITFTGIGALTLAGIITISNPLSFTAGNGRVIYVGIPGANQTISPLTYNRLVITGIGNGSKTINGNVIVTDSLTLLTDTLLINGSGSLTLNNNATIVKTAGKLLSAPTFLGQIDILYNDVQKDTTGPEMPTAANVLRNLFINNIAGVKLANSITVNNLLSLQNGELFTDNFILNINNPLGGTNTDPAINRTNGYVNGRINRSIGAGTGIRVFPFGIGLIQGYREYKIEFTLAPTVAGTLSVQHFNTAATAQSGLPLSDAGVMIALTQPYYWQADALNGLAGGTYNLTLTAEGSSGITNYTLARIVNRPSAGGSWVLNGTAGTNTGTNNAPAVVRNGMSNFSQFAIGYNTGTLPLTLLSFNATEQNGGILLQWKTANEINAAYFDIEKSSNGIYFNTLGKVYSASIYSFENNYRYLEKNLPNGVYYYRLKMFDTDGRFTYSPVIFITIKNKKELLVYPTITYSSFNISNANEIYLYNSAGSFMKRLYNGLNNISDLPNGLYILRNSETWVKIIKQ
ncbi:MAG: hypothetical protein H7Y86_06710 [Rhizobacter sp.]|nr:hypothetical protein [Ferruginibacter sp.]